MRVSPRCLHGGEAHRSSGGCAMKKVVLSLVLIGLLSLALGFAASAASAVDPVVPTVSGVEPASAYNDIDTLVTVTGSDFEVGIDGTVTVSLGAIPLTDVTWVDAQTLTATVPWGVTPGVYTLTVTNPGSGTPGTLTGAFEVKSGIGTWNAGELFGGTITQLLMKPRDSSNPNAADTLYALAGGVGLFRSTDAGESWRFIDNNVVQNADFVLDPSHPTWLYSYSYSRGESEGLWRSENEGDTWIWLSSPWLPATGEATGQREVFVSPHDPNILFLCSYSNPDDTFPTLDLGLKKSLDAGIHWSNVAGMPGVPVQSVAFDPANASNMVLATSDARVFRSTDGGTSWVPAMTPSTTLSDLGYTGFVTYNPHKSGEVWFVANGTPGGIFRSGDASLMSWHPVSPAAGGGAYSLSFPADDVVYTPRWFSTNDGDSWSTYGPVPWYGATSLVFAPDTTQIAYISDDDVGVRKTIDGGRTWLAKNQGLTGLRMASMDVSRADPLRVYASFMGPLGIYRSGDGTSHWTYYPISDSFNVHQVLEDPFDPSHVYAATDPGLYETTDTCETWTNLGWNVPPSSPNNSLYVLALDPHHEGHMLAAMGTGSFNTGQSWLYGSGDGGATWQGPITTPEDLRRVTSITFDPESSDTVYVTTFGTGLLRSTDSGASWTRIDDGTPEMKFLANVAIATHPRRVLMVQCDPGGFVAQAGSVRSLDGGSTWHDVAGVGGGTPSSCVFADYDSTRLYASSPWGLYFSGNMGDTWTAAAGILGKVEITGLNWGKADGHILIYAATNGGDAGTAAVSGTMAGGPRQTVLAATAPSTLVGAGIYRRAQVETTQTFYSSGSQDGWVLESSHTSSKGGTRDAASTTLRLGDNASKKQYRSVLSFGTSGLPDSAVITKVTLRFKKQGVTGGGNPLTTFRGLMVDIKKGYFGSSSALQVSDFQAATSRSYGAFHPALVGNWYSIDLTGAKGYVNKTSSSSGRTQIRLRFKLDDNNNSVANYLRLYSGNATTSVRPQLVVTYYVP